MAVKPQKPQKYPRKFRMKLEKMRNAREERAEQEVDETKARAISDRLLDTLYRYVIPKNSVHSMITRLDPDHLPAMRTTFSFKQRYQHAMITVTPPWNPADVPSKTTP